MSKLTSTLLEQHDRTPVTQTSMDIRRSVPTSDLEAAAWPRVPADLVEVLRNAGEIRELAGGEIVFDVGEEKYDFVFVETGSVDIVDRTTRRTMVRIEAGLFLGELSMLMGQASLYAAVVHEDARLVVIEQPRFRDLLRTSPDVADLVVPAFAARRRMAVERRDGGLVIVGRDGDPAALRLREFASRNRIPGRWIDREDESALAEIRRNHSIPDEGTLVITGDSTVLVDPDIRAAADATGMTLRVDTSDLFDIVIVGAGPAGLAASVYAASEGLSVLALEDMAIGGQAGTSSRIENYLGFPKGVSGSELAFLGEIQAVKFGARIAAPRRAVRLSRDGEFFVVTLDDDTTVRSRSVVLANGVQYRRLPLDRLEYFEGRGVYYAATDLEARFCRQSDAVIVGGGNSAGQAAMFLSQHARQVHLLVRGDSLSDTMSSYLSDRIGSHERIELWTHSEISRLNGDDALESVVVRNSHDGTERTIDTRALFIMIGAVPNTQWLDGQIELDDKGFVLTGAAAGGEAEGFSTSLPGVFAAGDVRADAIKRVASAVGEGSVVVSGVHRHLARQRRITPASP